MGLELFNILVESTPASDWQNVIDGGGYSSAFAVTLFTLLPHHPIAGENFVTLLIDRVERGKELSENHKIQYTL
ncbi:MAG TPA: hypothetical protein IGR89_14245 [Oscillatoriaceae cyanobacterium M7585_C2015_266]|nr:hypothetical protein [Oscillatoriaceae cyanobacterium M7585_C2015_266]